MINKIRKTTVRIIIFTGLLALTISCSSKTVDIKSPCVSLEGGPCGPKRSVNDWWMKANT